MYCGVLLDSHWQALAPILGEPDLAEHPSFATREARSANRDVCNMMLGGWMAERTRAEAIATLGGQGLPIAPVQTFVQAAQDPHVLERDMLQPTVVQGSVEIPITGPAVKFSRTPTSVRRAAPALGEHTEEVLAELGVDAETLRRLQDAGITG